MTKNTKHKKKRSNKRKKTYKDFENEIREENEAIITILNECESFRVDVENIRSNHTISAYGFKSEGEANITKYLEKWRNERNMSDEVWDYLKYPVNQEPIKIYHRNTSVLVDSLNSNPDYTNWFTDVKQLCNKYRLHEHFQPYIEQFILTGKIVAPNRNHYLKLRTNAQNIGLGVTTVVVYGAPSTNEAELIKRQLNPVKQLIGELIGHENTRQTKQRVAHPIDASRADKNLKLYANVLILERERNKYGHKNAWIAAELSSRYGQKISEGMVSKYKVRAKKFQRAAFGCDISA